MTDKEKYGHDNMTDDELEDRAAADLFELHERFKKDEHVKSIGSLIWRLMSQLRQAYRTAKLIQGRQ